MPRRSRKAGSGLLIVSGVVGLKEEDIVQPSEGLPIFFVHVSVRGMLPGLRDALEVKSTSPEYVMACCAKVPNARLRIVISAAVAATILDMLC